MAYCRQCGNEMAAGESFCRQCGAKLSIPSGGPGASSTGVRDDELALFIGKNADVYLRKFEKFTQGGTESYAVTWNWPAFLFGIFWMLYRKLYLWALGLFVISFIPFFGFFAGIAAGMTANYIYFRHARKKLTELNARLPSAGPDREEGIAKAGGTHKAVLVLIPLVAVAVAAIIAAIAIPQFAAYRERAFDTKAKQQVQEACRLGQEWFSAKPDRAVIEPDDLLYAGLERTEDVDMMLLDGRKGSFRLSSRHVKSSTVYITDKECRLSEEQRAQ